MSALEFRRADLPARALRSVASRDTPLPPQECRRGCAFAAGAHRRALVLGARAHRDLRSRRPSLPPSTRPLGGACAPSARFRVGGRGGGVHLLDRTPASGPVAAATVGAWAPASTYEPTRWPAYTCPPPLHPVSLVAGHVRAVAAWPTEGVPLFCPPGRQHSPGLHLIRWRLRVPTRQPRVGVATRSSHGWSSCLCPRWGPHRPPHPPPPLIPACPLSSLRSPSLPSLPVQSCPPPRSLWMGWR